MLSMYNNKDMPKDSIKLGHKLLLINKLYEHNTLSSLIAAYEILKTIEPQSQIKAVRGWQGIVIVDLYKQFLVQNFNSEIEQLQQELGNHLIQESKKNL